MHPTSTNPPPHENDPLDWLPKTKNPWFGKAKKGGAILTGLLLLDGDTPAEEPKPDEGKDDKDKSGGGGDSDSESSPDNDDKKPKPEEKRESDTKPNKEVKPSNPGKMDREVKKGAPGTRGIERVEKHRGNDKEYNKPHVHFDDGTSLNQDGTTHDKKNGQPNPTGKQKKWLKKHGWKLPGQK